jgi:methylated-DNA-protein-cysteine methyltransferase related protein
VKAASPFFARIQKDVFEILKSVPKGALVTFKDIGVHLDVVPRHVAYILAMPDPALRSEVPWHRAIPHNGVLKTTKAQSGPTQAELLKKEGMLVLPNGAMVDFQHRVREIASLPHKVPKQTRPANQAGKRPSIDGMKQKRPST